MISENISRSNKYKSFRKDVQEEKLPIKPLYFSTIINWYYEEEKTVPLVEGKEICISLLLQQEGAPQMGAP